MEQPKNFDFDEEEVMLRDSARKFFEKKLPTDRLHALVAADPNPERAPECLWDRELWRQMVELGWTTLAVPQRAGGMGMISGRKAFQKPMKDGVELLNAIQDVYLCEEVTVA